MSSMAVAGQFAGSELLVEQRDCRVFLGDRELGSGTIRITESDVSWSSCDDRERLNLDYPRICVHAISRDVTNFPSPCVYLLYSASPPDSASSGSDDEGEVPDIDELPPTEVRLVPPNSDQLETIYSAICECQLLYPDPEQSDSSCEEEIAGAECSEEDIQHIHQCPADFFTSADGLEHLTAEGEAVLAHLESILHIEAQQDSENGDADNGQFEDADITDNY